jgi:hypothetical protein
MCFVKLLAIHSLILVIVFFSEASKENYLPRKANGWNSLGSVGPLTKLALASLRVAVGA